ncbi:MAG: hypothetical protein WCA85_25860 [Paraburkholderia sp.]
MPKAVVYVVIFVAIAAVLGSRRIGWGNWQSWAIYALMGAAAIAGRLA